MSEANRMADQELYYLQDTRAHVGNSMMWWAKDKYGYVCDIRKAHVWTKDEAYRQHASRSTDKPWRKAYIDARISHHIDMQHCERDDPEAL